MGNEFSEFVEESMELEDRCRLIEATKIGRDLQWSQLKLFASKMTLYRAPEKLEICEEGEEGGSMGIIVQGEVKILKRGIDTEARLVKELQPGRTFGEISIIDEGPRSATVVAEPGTRLLVIQKEEFQHLLEEKPGLGVELLRKISRLLSQRLRQTTGRLSEHLEDPEE